MNKNKIILSKEIYNYIKRKDIYSSLGELLSTLVLGVLDQFHDTTFIGSETSNFTDDVADEISALTEGL